MTGRTVTYGYERARAVALARGAVPLGGTGPGYLALARSSSHFFAMLARLSAGFCWPR
jgi:hypothetical protein